MVDSVINTSQEREQPLLHLGLKIASFLLSLFVFLVAIEMMVSSFKFMGAEWISLMITATSNPFVGLFIGLLGTSIIQSSGTTTSMIVALVASGSLSLDNAIPMVMGANIGTTITSTIVSLGHITRRKEFKRAITAATMHDFFNILVALILFPLEYYTRFLAQTSSFLSHYVGFSESSEPFFMQVTIKASAHWLVTHLGTNPWIKVILSVSVLFLSLHFFARQLRPMFMGRYKERFEYWIFGSDIKSLISGCVLTAAVHSSSVVTSLAVPMAATQKVSIERLFPFVMGANIGTTLTALIAAMYKSEAAVSIALVHVLFNVIGTLLFFPIPQLRKIPLWCADWLGTATMQNRMTGFIYILVMFFLIPFLLIFSSIHFEEEKETQKQQEQKTTSLASIKKQNT